MKYSADFRLRNSLQFLMAAVFIGGIAVLCGLFVFPEQECKDGFFLNANVECLDCHDFLGEKCF